MPHESDLNDIRETIASARKIAVFSHIRPDGDTIGSALGLGWALAENGKQVQIICEDEIPPHFCFLFPPDANPFLRQPSEAFDCSIVVDVSDLRRTGSYFNTLEGRIPDICFDHHVSNPGFARQNWIEPDSPATACVLYGLLPKLGLSLSKRIASALLCGIITDTLGFSTSNTNAAVLHAGADLVNAGADIFTITQNALKAHSTQAARYWGYGLTNMQKDGEILWSVLSLADRHASAYPDNDDADFVNYLSCDDDSSIALLFVEQSSLETKVSWRGKPGQDVQKIAAAFGGGGHKAAAGATLKGSLDEVIREVLQRTKEMAAKTR